MLCSYVLLVDSWLKSSLHPLMVQNAIDTFVDSTESSFLMAYMFSHVQFIRQHKL